MSLLKLKFAALLLAPPLLLSLPPITALSGCGQADAKDKLSVVCTVFPQYDWARQIIGSKTDVFDITLLLDKKIDLHSYQPSVEDIAKISRCDLFVYVGGESDDWVRDALKEAVNKKLIAINLIEKLGEAAKAEEIVDGMEDDAGADEDADGDKDEGEAEYDEHIWLSLRNAKALCAVITEAVASLDAGNAKVYNSNLAAYAAKLDALDREYQAAVDAAPVKTLVFGDRFPFRYLVDDYGIKYSAAFAGCSAETEASFDTIIFLVNKINELGLKNIIVTESSDKKIAETIIRESKNKNQNILTLDSMQSSAASDVEEGKTYLSIMENNLEALKEALGG